MKNTVIYFDMDGVLCDFDKQADKHNIWKPENHKPDWKKTQEIGESFWSEMEPIPEGLNLLKEVEKAGYEIGIFSAIHLDCGKKGKRDWLSKYLPQIPKKNIIIVRSGSMKHKFAKKNSMLIDDKSSNVDNYISVGEKGLLFTKNTTLSDVLDALNGSTSN